MKKHIAIILVFLLHFFAFSQKTEHRNLDNKLAIQGYDPVSYIEQNKAVKGKKEFAVNVNGAIYYTSSAKNKELLKISNQIRTSLWRLVRICNGRLWRKSRD
jgi:hypothetical protein